MTNGNLDLEKKDYSRRIHEEKKQRTANTRRRRRRLLIVSTECKRDFSFENNRGKVVAQAAEKGDASGGASSSPGRGARGRGADAGISGA